MSTVFFRRLSGIRELKVERSQREVLQARDQLSACEDALRAASAAHAGEVARRYAVSQRWRAQRLALADFDQQATIGHEAELRRCDQRIAAALCVVERLAAQRDAASCALQAAQAQLDRRRAELAKAEQGVSQFRALERARDEAAEEDEMDELAVLRRAPALMESP